MVEGPADQFESDANPSCSGQKYEREEITVRVTASIPGLTMRFRVEENLKIATSNKMKIKPW